MKLHLFLSFLFSISICLQENGQPITAIIFYDDHVSQIPDNTAIDGTTVVIEQPGIFHVSGKANEGVIVIKSSSVTLQLENLKLSSKKTAPIIITNTLKDVQIINKGETELNDYEDKKTTEGECAVIKIKKNSIVSFQNEGTLILNGKCKYIIKGGPQSSIIFKKSSGDYKITASKTAIESDGLLEFNGGYFDIESTKGDAIKSLPDDMDNNSLGKILVNDGNFKIHCFNDVFTTKNNITIVKGISYITTEEGYDSETYNETESSKGFKLTNNDTGREIKIHSGEFNMNTADDAFRSNRDITIISGKFTIQTKDDGICAKYNLVLGKKDAPLDDLNINILDSYEAIEGMTVTIYSGKIIGTSHDDGINASGVIRKQRTHGNHTFRNRTRRNNTERNESRDDDPFDGQRRPGENNTHVGAAPNDSYIIRIYGGEVYLYTDSDGIDSNGHIYVHGGKISIFSQGKGANEPIDHNGNFTLFNAEILGVGTGGLEFIHEGIKKGNQMYGYFFGIVKKDKKLEIFDDNNQLVNEGYITKDINYIFYTSLKLNENYHFYIIDESTNNRTELEIVYGFPEEGEDDEDTFYKKTTENENHSKNLKITILEILIILVLL